MQSTGHVLDIYSTHGEHCRIQIEKDENVAIHELNKINQTIYDILNDMLLDIL